MPGAPTGGSAGQAMAAHVARAVASVMDQMAPIQQARRVQANTGHIETMEQELKDFIGPIVEAFTAHGEAPFGLGPLLAQAADPDHQVSFIGQIGVIISAVFILAFQMGQPLARDALNTVYSSHQHENVPLGELVSLLAHRWVDRDFAHWQAGNQGYRGDFVDTMTAGAYQVLSAAQVMEALNRGAMPEGDAADWLAHSGIHPFLVPVVEALRFQRADPGSAIAAVVQSHLTADQAAGVLKAHGIDTADLGWLVETAGRPPGVFELGELVNRGELSLDEWAQAIRESDVKNKYIPALQNLRFKIPPERTVVSMMRKGGITAAQGATWLHMLGFHPDAVAALVAEATEDKLAAHKDLSVSMTTEAYELHLMTRQQAADTLNALGYDANEAAFILDIHTHKRELTVRNQAVAAVRSHYVGHKIDRTEAGRELDGLGLPADERDALVNTWDLELKGNVRLLSEAQLAAFVSHGVMDTPTYRRRLADLGYQADDIDLLVRYRGL